MHGPKNNEVGDYEIRTNEELRILFGEVSVIGFMKRSRIRRAGHVWRSEGLGGIQQDGDRTQKWPRR